MAMMRIWIDGQCLQTASADRGIGRYVHELIGGIGAYCPEVELSISFNAAMPERAIVAGDRVSRWIEPRNIHIWQGVAEGGEGNVGLTARRRLSEIVLAHHGACLAPDVALSASPYEGHSDPAVPLFPVDALQLPVTAIFYDAIPHRYAKQYQTTRKIASFYTRRMAMLGRFDARGIA